MAHVSDVSTDDDSRTGVATEDPDAADLLGDLPVTVSAIVDVNNVSECADATTLHRASSLVAAQTGLMINVVAGNRIRNEHDDPSYFTLAFPTRFCWGTGGHLDPRRKPAHALSLCRMDPLHSLTLLQAISSRSQIHLALFRPRSASPQHVEDQFSGFGYGVMAPHPTPEPFSSLLPQSD
jgi:hypothetical protein